jgi:hypothetical protein
MLDHVRLRGLIAAMTKLYVRTIQRPNERPHMGTTNTVQQLSFEENSIHEPELQYRRQSQPKDPS